MVHWGSSKCRSLRPIVGTLGNGGALVVVQYVWTLNMLVQRSI